MLGILVCVNVTSRADGIDNMKTSIRNRATALGIAAAAGLAGIGITAGPALASIDSTPAATAAATQSSGHPTNSLKYADKLVRAFGVGSDVDVERLATDAVVKTLSEHGDAHAGRWHRIAADSAAGSTYVAYTNLDTGEKMTLGVSNEKSANGDDDAVRQIRFDD